MTGTRTTIATHVEEHPGIHFNELVRSLDLAAGQAQYHLEKLLRRGTLVQEDLYGRSHYFPLGYDATDRRTVALLRQETAREIVVHLLGNPGARPNAVAEAVGIARSTLEWHLGRLTEQDLVEKRRDDRGNVSLHLTRPAETLRRLGDITPSLSDRFIDRFIRVFDQVVEDTGRT